MTSCACSPTIGNRTARQRWNKCAKTIPARYCELIAKIVPKEMLIASDRTPRPNEPQTSRDIANMLLLSAGITEPDDSDREKALEAYDAMNIRLDEIAAEKGLH